MDVLDIARFFTGRLAPFRFEFNAIRDEPDGKRKKLRRDWPIGGDRGSVAMSFDGQGSQRNWLEMRKTPV